MGNVLSFIDDPAGALFDELQQGPAQGGLAATRLAYQAQGFAAIHL